MYSLQSDLVLDPFAGTGTVAQSALSLGRNSLSIELDKSFQPVILSQLLNSTDDLNSKVRQRLLDHIQFTKEARFKKAKPFQYKNLHYGFPVMTGQEVFIQFPYIESIRQENPKLVSAKHSFSPSFFYPLTKNTPLFNKKQLGPK